MRTTVRAKGFGHMAIEPKSPRKRAAKKKSTPTALESEAPVVTPETTEAAPAKTRKKAAAVPVPVFQAAPTEKAPKSAPKKAAAKKAEIGRAHV